MKFHHRWATAALFAIASSVSAIAHAAPVSGQGTWETTLQGRDLDGNPATFEAYYDTDLNITWLADANYARGSSFDTESPDGYVDGIMKQEYATAWAASLSFYNSATGVTWDDWRLPSLSESQNRCDGFYCTDNEMGHLYYVTLGNDIWWLSNTGPFTNLIASEYWFGNEPGRMFSFDSGSVGWGNDGYAMAVHDGDIAAVPTPAAVWLLGSGLLGLIGIGCRMVSH